MLKFILFASSIFVGNLAQGASFQVPCIPDTQFNVQTAASRGLVRCSFVREQMMARLINKIDYIAKKMYDGEIPTFTQDGPKANKVFNDKDLGARSKYALFTIANPTNSCSDEFSPSPLPSPGWPENFRNIKNQTPGPHIYQVVQKQGRRTFKISWKTDVNGGAQHSDWAGRRDGEFETSIATGALISSQYRTASVIKNELNSPNLMIQLAPGCVPLAEKFKGVNSDLLKYTNTTFYGERLVDSRQDDISKGGIGNQQGFIMKAKLETIMNSAYEVVECSLHHRAQSALEAVTTNYLRPTPTNYDHLLVNEQTRMNYLKNLVKFECTSPPKIPLAGASGQDPEVCADAQILSIAQQKLSGSDSHPCSSNLIEKITIKASTACIAAQCPPGAPSSCSASCPDPGNSAKLCKTSNSNSFCQTERDKVYTALKNPDYIGDTENFDFHSNPSALNDILASCTPYLGQLFEDAGNACTSPSGNAQTEWNANICYRNRAKENLYKLINGNFGLGTSCNQLKNNYLGAGKIKDWNEGGK